MDQSCSTSHGEVSRMLLGFFLQPIFYICNDPRNTELTTTGFLPVTIKGKELKDGKWGSLDASLSFIGQKVYISGSSGGFLLCCFEVTQQENYCICNPVTQEWRMLPRPNKMYEEVAIFFSCRGNKTQLDGVHFTVVRAGSSNYRESSTKLELETYSSETGEWRESTVACAKPFRLVVWDMPAFENGGIIFWRDGPRLVAYNPTTERAEVIEPPGDPWSFLQYSDVWDPSEGRLFYARHDCTYFEVWALEQRCARSYGHVLVTRVSLAVMFQLTPETAARGEKVFNGLDIVAISPHASKLILLRWNAVPYWYNIETGKFWKCLDSSADGPMPPYIYFQYEWPSDIISH